jgi:hypothetical protein
VHRAVSTANAASAETKPIGEDGHQFLLAALIGVFSDFFHDMRFLADRDIEQIRGNFVRE